MNCNVRKLTVSLVVSALLTQLSHAQGNFPESERAKRPKLRTKRRKKANAEAYKATLERAPVVNQKVDPWGSLRTPSAKGNK
jgi:hypothetical protein